MLILLPASDAKAPDLRGASLDLSELSFPPLGPTRAAVLHALTEVSAAPDAARRLGVRASMADAVRGNLTLREAPAAAVESVYAGVLYDALGLGDLDGPSRRRARRWIVVVSALWGAVRLGDRIPSYRLDMCGRLPGLPHLPDVWREPLGDVLPAATGRGVIVDCRSSAYATAWRPTGTLAERTVVVKVTGRDHTRIGSHNAKYTRGLVVRRIVTHAVDPPGPEGLADALAEHFEVDLRRPRRPATAWELGVVDALD